MGEILRSFLSSAFMPHGHCYFWTSSLLALHAISDALIGLAYVTIPVTLTYIVRRRHDLPFNWMMLCFATFIIACGATHWMEVWTIWHAHYWVAGAVKAVTAVASVGTAVLLVQLVPAILAIPSQAQLEAAYTALRASEEKLRDLNAQLEVRVSERTRELEESLAQARELQDQLVQSQKLEAVGRLAGGIAHDVNNMLTVIQGFTDVLLEHAPPGEPRRAAHEIRSASDRTAHLTAQLLAFSRKQVLRQAPLVLDEVVGRAAAMLRRLVGEDVPIEVVTGAEGGIIRADATQIEQILMNLVLNARDAMPCGGPIRLETDLVFVNAQLGVKHGVEPGEYLRLAVVDRGAGIAPHVLPRIFEPFFTTKPPGQGTGLGLATTHGIVTQSGGFIDVASTLGAGTTVSVMLPRSDAAPLPVSAAPTADARGSGTVLVVDDEGKVREAVVMALRRRGYVVHEAADAKSARAMIEQHGRSIDLLITDVVMPGVYGPQLHAQLAELRAGLPVLYISGYADDQLSRHGVTDEAAFLAKPFAPAELCRRVEAILVPKKG